jgi:hypothetical protein
VARPKKAVTKRLFSMWLDPSQLRDLRAVQVRDGIVVSEQIRRAIDHWLRRRRVGKGGRTKA